MKKTINGVTVEIVSVIDFEKRTGVHITKVHLGKMAGLWSISTSAKRNPLCQKYCKDPKKVCSHCFALRDFKIRHTLENRMALNTEALTKDVLTVMSLLPSSFPQRIESFGDLSTVEQAVNYILYATVNPQCKFALWTKNPHILQAAFDRGFKKPKNLSIVLSSFYLNEERDASKWPWVDHTFTVWSHKEGKFDNGIINCGARSCLTCGKCYKNKARNPKTNVFSINEKLK